MPHVCRWVPFEWKRSLRGARGCVARVGYAAEFEERPPELAVRHLSLGYGQALRELRQRAIPTLVARVDGEGPGAVLGG